MGDAMFDQLTEQQLRGRKTIKWNHFGPDVLPLWIAEMDFPTAPAVVDGIRACVAGCAQHTVGGQVGQHRLLQAGQGAVLQVRQ